MNVRPVATSQESGRNTIASDAVPSHRPGVSARSGPPFLVAVLASIASSGSHAHSVYEGSPVEVSSALLAIGVALVLLAVLLGRRRSRVPAITVAAVLLVVAAVGAWQASVLGLASGLFAWFGLAPWALVAVLLVILWRTTGDRRPR